MFVLVMLDNRQAYMVTPGQFTFDQTEAAQFQTLEEAWETALSASEYSAVVPQEFMG